jgi:hypothetical protein
LAKSKKNRFKFEAVFFDLILFNYFFHLIEN